MPVSSGNSQTRLVSFLTADSDPGQYGKLQSFTMPQGQTVLGPVQVNNAIIRTPAISTAITLLNQQGSQIIQGSMQLIPVGNSIVYVRPFYAPGPRQRGYPQFQFVVVFTQDYGRVLRPDGAGRPRPDARAAHDRHHLQRVGGGHSPAAPAPAARPRRRRTTTPPGATTTTAPRARPPRSRRRPGARRTCSTRPPSKLDQAQAALDAPATSGSTRPLVDEARSPGEAGPGQLGQVDPTAVGAGVGDPPGDCYYGGSGNTSAALAGSPIAWESAAMAVSGIDLGKYKLGWSDSTDDYVYAPDKGLNESVVRDISYQKSEPEWMTKFRLNALKRFERKPMLEWFAKNMPDIDFDDIYYYLKPTDGQVTDWDMLPDDMKKTYEKLGIPEAERKYLAGRHRAVRLGDRVPQEP